MASHKTKDDPGAPVALDEKDRRILSTLQRDARLSYRELARRTGYSLLTVMKRVRALEQQGAILGSRLKLDYERLGYNVHAIIEVRIAKGKLFEMERKIAGERGVYAVFDHTGPFDTTLLARFRTTRELDRFLKRIQTYEFVERTETKLILNTMKLEDVEPA